MRSSTFHRGGICLLLLMVSACAMGGCTNPLTHISARAKDVEKYQSRDSLTLGGKIRASQSSRPARGEVVNVLTLSGGGAWGAWGAGYLIGWKQNPKVPRPESFDLVTGISTGALQATAAFLPEDEVLRKGYTGVSQSDIMRHRFPPYLAALWSSSLYDDSPLAELIIRLITNDVIDRVAARAQGPNGERKLYVASVELNSGDLVFWDLTDIAKDKQYDLYRSVVLASASLPAAFPPVEIAGKLHVDGGTRTSLFINDALFELVKIHGVNMNVFTIVNGRTVIDPAPAEESAISVAKRSVSLLLGAQTWSNLREITRFAQDHEAIFRLSCVPADYQAHAEHDFDPVEMQTLFDLGLDAGKNDQWEFVRGGKWDKPYFRSEKIQSQMSSTSQ
jgi:predicted acylesterase/phospholipase RssA